MEARNRSLKLNNYAHIIAMCGQREVDIDVISAHNVKTSDTYHWIDFEIVSSSSFRENYYYCCNLCDASTTLVQLKPHFLSQGAQNV